MNSLSTLRALALLRKETAGIVTPTGKGFVTMAIIDTVDAWVAEGCPGYAPGEAEKKPKRLMPEQTAILAALSDAVADLNERTEPPTVEDLEALGRTYHGGGG